MPGLVTLVSRRGEVHIDAIGRKALGGSDPMRRDTIFRISSLTKPITAAAAMILVEECMLRLDDPVDRWLPELTPEQRAEASPFLGDNRGWGFGVSVITKRDDVASVLGRFGWDGGLGASWYADPREDMVGILMTQRAVFLSQGS